MKIELDIPVELIKILKKIVKTDEITGAKIQKEMGIAPTTYKSIEAAAYDLLDSSAKSLLQSINRRRVEDADKISAQLELAFMEIDKEYADGYIEGFRINTVYF